MLYTLKLILDHDNLSYRQSSLLQAVMFEHVDFVDKMHQQNLHPYSQYLTTEGGRTVWVINTLTEEAYEKIINPLRQETFSSFKLIQKDDMEVNIVGRNLKATDRKTLLNGFYQEQPVLSFLTPTAFRQNGRYVILPDMRLVYQNLMMRYSASSCQIDMVDEDTLNYMVSSSYISGYRLSSHSFPMKHTWIPGFTGTITINFSGKSTISQYIKLLLRFGEYSGVGIKTGMGMGAVQIIKENANEGR